MTTNNIKICGPKEISEELSKGAVCLIDVREPAEYLSEKVDGAENFPLSNLEKLIGDIPKDKPIVLMCRSGMRAQQAAKKLADAGIRNVKVIEGGIESWKTCGLPVQKGTSSVWAIDRQVRFTAGVLILLGILGSWWIHSGWIGLSLFVAAGLIFAAITDTCGMAMLLAKMPWNK